MIVDGALGTMFMYAIVASGFALLVAFFGDDKSIKKPLIISAFVLPIMPFLFFGESDELYCDSFHSGLKTIDEDSPFEITPRDTTTFPERVEIKIYKDFRAYWAGGPSGENLDFSDIRGNFQDDQYDDLGELKSISYASWTGNYSSCGGYPSIECLVIASYAPRRHNLSIIKESIIDNWIPLPTEGDMLILSSATEYAYYDCVSFTD